MTISNTARLCAWLCGATALVSPAFAADRPADPAGAKTVADFVAAYLGKAAAPSIKVTSEGSSYLVSFDLGAATAAMKGAGFVYDAAELKFRVFQQDDGQWRVETAAVPPISGHMTRPDGKGDVDLRVEVDNLKHTTLIDPRLGWIASSHGGADQLRMTQHGPGFDQQLELGKLGFDATTKRDGAGLTMSVSEPVDALNLVMDVDPKGVDPASQKPAKPTHISAKGEGGKVDIAIKGFQPGPLTDAWKFVAAHPERADYARDFDALKGVVNAVIADGFTADETFKLGKLNVTTDSGPIAIEGVTFGAGAVNGGSNAGFSEHFAATAIKLPDGLVPSIYAPVIPTAFDIAFKASGFDLAAAAQEWFADAHLDADGPPLTPEARAKVSAKLTGTRPIVVDIAPSRVIGPSLNIAFEGKVTIDNTQPIGSVTIAVRNFDQTEQAIQSLGPKAEQQLVPVIAMAKGLSKPGPDGALVWVCDLGRDHVMKVNGLPLGKSPF